MNRPVGYDTRPPITAAEIREMRADGLDWDSIRQRTGRSESGLRAIMKGERVPGRRPGRARKVRR